MRRLIEFAVVWFLLLFFAAVVEAQTVTATYNLSWKDNSGTEEGVKIERRTKTGTFSQITVVAPNVVLYQDVVNDDLERCYRVRAFNAAGDSDYSNEACLLHKPADPTAFTVTGILTITGTIQITPTP